MNNEPSAEVTRHKLFAMWDAQSARIRELEGVLTEAINDIKFLMGTVPIIGRPEREEIYDNIERYRAALSEPEGQKVG